jgi:hypothetical protein
MPLQRVEIQSESPGSFDVLVNGDHYLRVYDHAEAMGFAIQAMTECGLFRFTDHTPEGAAVKARMDDPMR